VTGAVASRQFADLEAVIERGRQTFIEVGDALKQIRDRHLYRETHATFEAYCRERWGWSRSYAHRNIEAAEAVQTLPNGNRPTTEAQARELVPLTPDERALVAADVDFSTATARQVRDVVDITRTAAEPNMVALDDFARKLASQVNSVLNRDLMAEKMDALLPEVDDLGPVARKELAACLRGLDVRVRSCLARVESGPDRQAEALSPAEKRANTPADVFTREMHQLVSIVDGLFVNIDIGDIAATPAQLRKLAHVLHALGKVRRTVEQNARRAKAFGTGLDERVEHLHDGGVDR